MSQTTNPYLTEGSPSTNPLAPYYEDKRTKAGDEKDSSLKDLSASRSLQRQEASINHELLKKYLPELNAANGLTGLGVSESFNLDSLSRYQNTLSDIERKYQSGVSEVERAYDDRISKIDTEERTEYTTNKNSEYTTALDQIKYGLYTTEDDLESYIDTLTFLDNDQKAQLYEIGMGVINKNKTDKSESNKGEIQTAAIRGAITDEESLKDYLLTLGYTEGSEEYTTLFDYGKGFLPKEDDGKKVSPDGSPLPESAPGKIKGEKVQISYPSQNGERGGSFTLYLGGETVDEKVIEEADKKDNGDVWMSGKTMYIKHNGDVYELVDENGGRMSESYGEAYAYFTENKTPDSDFFEKTPETDVKMTKISDGVVYYKDSTGEEKGSRALPIPRSMWTSDLEKYKLNDNVIFESDGDYYIWQDKKLYSLFEIDG